MGKWGGSNAGRQGERKKWGLVQFDSSLLSKCAELTI